MFVLDPQQKLSIGLHSFTPEDGVICDMQCINSTLHWLKRGDNYALDV